MKSSAVLAVSILIGVLSHTAWDSFTHSYGWSVEHFSVLQQTFSLGTVSVPIFKLLQYSGHLLGVPILLFYYLFVTRSNSSERLLTRDTLKVRIPFLLKYSAVEAVLLLIAIIYTFISFCEHGIYRGVGKITISFFNLNVFTIVLFSFVHRVKAFTLAKE